MFKATTKFLRKIITKDSKKNFLGKFNNKIKSKSISPKCKRHNLTTANASITHVYFEIHDGRKNLLGKDNNGVFYLGKAVFKNKVRQEISIKLYNNYLENNLVHNYLNTIKDLKHIKSNLDKKLNKHMINKHFPNINIVKTQTERKPSGEWVQIGPNFDKLNTHFSFRDLRNISKKDLVYAYSVLIESGYSPNVHMVLEFLDKKTNQPLDLDLIIKSKINDNSSFYNTFKNLTSKLKWLAKEFNKTNEGFSEYNKFLFDFCGYSLDAITNRKLKKFLTDFRNNIRFDLI